LSIYTRLGATIWDWEPFTSLDGNGRSLWLALYTSAEAKRTVPGLWHGSITAMAEAAKMAADDVIKSLDTMLERDLVEFDQKLRVLRLTQLPDPGESPANGKILRSWWLRFKTVPMCAVRDAHVAVLRWIMDAWSRENGKAVSSDHEKTWDETFATVVVPAPRRRGVRRLMESDTSTSSQPSLFGPNPPSSRASDPPVDRFDTVSQTVSDARSVDNSAVLRQSNKITGPETVSDTVSKRYGSGSGSGSGSFSSSGIGGGPQPSGAGLPGDRDLVATGKPVLALVPDPLPFTVAQVLATLAESSQGRFSARIDGILVADRLSVAVRQLADHGVSLADLALLGSWIAHGLRHEIPDLRGDAEWASRPNALLQAVRIAQREEASALARSELAQAARTQLGF
jgi:hypothetical protein